MVCRCACIETQAIVCNVFNYKLIISRNYELTCRRYCNETLLLLAISFLNDSDWQLRSSFYAALPCLAGGVGSSGFDLFLRPCLDKVSQQNRIGSGFKVGFKGYCMLAPLLVAMPR